MVGRAINSAKSFQPLEITPLLSVKSTHYGTNLNSAMRKNDVAAAVMNWGMPRILSSRSS